MTYCWIEMELKTNDDSVFFDDILKRLIAFKRV